METVAARVKEYHEQGFALVDELWSTGRIEELECELEKYIEGMNRCTLSEEGAIRWLPV